MRGVVIKSNSADRVPHGFIGAGLSGMVCRADNDN